MRPVKAVLRLCIVAVAAAVVVITAVVVACGFIIAVIFACGFGRSARGCVGVRHGRTDAAARRSLRTERSSRVTGIVCDSGVARIGDIAVIIVIIILIVTVTVSVTVTVAVTAIAITNVVIIIDAALAVVTFALVATLLETIVIGIVVATGICSGIASLRLICVFARLKHRRITILRWHLATQPKQHPLPWLLS
jgi:hypothetical protein